MRRPGDDRDLYTSRRAQANAIRCARRLDWLGENDLCGLLPPGALVKEREN